MKIKELEVGKGYTLPLVVLAATARETRAKKPYLAIDFFDGTDKISGNYWDWSGKAKPETNAILNVTAAVTEWQGTKQLTISALSTNTELHLSEFMPNVGLNVSDVYSEAYALALDINDDFLRNLCLCLLEDLNSLWLTAPAAIGVHHAYVAGTLIHSLSVAKISKALASNIEGANVDLATAGGLLHDLGKLYGYHINGIVCEMTTVGKLFDHLFIGAEFVGNFAENHHLVSNSADDTRLQLLRHVILSHHGTQDHGAVVPPVLLEAHIVHHADAIDAASEMIRDASRKAGSNMWTDKIWGLNNRPHLAIDYVQAALDG